MSRKAKKNEMKLPYVFVEPKTEAEGADMEQRLHRAYDILFTAVDAQEDDPNEK